MKNLAILLLTLTWDYPGDYSGIVFEVWGAPTLASPWTLVAETPRTEWCFEPTGASGFFKVRARDKVTGLVSDWATGA
jgi:hypothetical protein